MRKGYDLLGLYHDADDPRIVVPKRMKALGWTVNVGHPKGQLASAGKRGDDNSDRRRNTVRVIRPMPASDSSYASAAPSI